MVISIFMALFMGSCRCLFLLTKYTSKLCYFKTCILTISSYFMHIMCTVPFTYQDPVEY